MTCGMCHRDFSGSACECGWSPFSPASSRTVTRCENCQLVVCIGAPTGGTPKKCHWHREWARIKDRMGPTDHRREWEAFEQWHREIYTIYFPESNAGDLWLKMHGEEVPEKPESLPLPGMHTCR